MAKSLCIYIMYIQFNVCNFCQQKSEVYTLEKLKHHKEKKKSVLMEQVFQISLVIKTLFFFLFFFLRFKEFE